MSGLSFVGKDQVNAYRMITLRSALKLELLGMKHSRGSVYALVKREFNLKGNKQKVFDQFNEIVKQTTGV